MNHLLLEDTVRRALNEDLGPGDITTQATVSAGRRATAQIVSRSPGVLCGWPAAELAYRLLDPTVELEPLVAEGGRLSPGQILARAHGQARALLSAERVALNFLQHLSGIATATAHAVLAVKPFPVTIVDTRKTTPGLRMLEKYAVRIGGGANHRLGLSDAVLIKDNHLELAGGVGSAVALVRGRVGPLVKVEVEAETLAQVEEALAAGADVIMLDNMPLETMRRAVEMVAGRALLEASGNVTPANAAQVAATGVDFISLGSITHSAPPLDLSQQMPACGAVCELARTAS